MPSSIPHQKFCFYYLHTRGRAGIKLRDAWYVSNVSIIFDCSMLYYLLFWTSLGFIIHFYIIFGTNQLTRGPVQNCCFLPALVFRRKGKSNEVQTGWNLRERSFWNKYEPGDLEWTSSNQRGSHEAGGAPTPLGTPSTLMGPSLLHLRTSSSYIYPRTPQTSGAPRKPNSTTATFYTREIPSWGLFRRPAGGGIDHGGLLHQHHSLSDDVWVVYLKPSGP